MAEVTSRPPAPTPASDASRTSGGDTDWTVQAADTIETFVGTIRDKTVVPATTVARGIVYGLVAGVLGLVILIMAIIIIVRLGTVYLPGWFADKRGRSAWATQVVLGGILTIGGLFLLRKAN